MVRTVDPIRHVREHPHMYFSDGRADPRELTSRLTGDALLLGATDARAIGDGNRWAVAADVDWLARAPIPVSELFRNVVPFPEAGANSLRSEVLAGAFATAWATWGPDGACTSGAGAGERFDVLRLRLGSGWARVVAFEMAPVATPPAEAAAHTV